MGHLVRIVRRLKWPAIIFGLVTVFYIGIGAWQAAGILHRTLTLGAPTAQSSGWPAPQKPADIGYQGDPMAAYGFAFTTVELDTPLGPAPAWLIPPATAPASASPWVIFVHGIGGRRENGYRFVPNVHEIGLPMLLISYRNDQGAPTDPTGLYAFGLTEWPDLEAAIRYATDQGASSVILIAESMGGGLAGQFLAHSPLADQVLALVLDAPAVDFPTLFTDQIAKMGLPLAPLLSPVALWMSSWQMPIRLADAVTTAPIDAFAGPLFISHGTSDNVVPIATSDSLVAGRSFPSTYMRTHAGHIQSWQEDPARYDALLRAFLTTLP